MSMTFPLDWMGLWCMCAAQSGRFCSNGHMAQSGAAQGRSTTRWVAPRAVVAKKKKSTVELKAKKKNV